MLICQPVSGSPTSSVSSRSPSRHDAVMAVSDLPRLLTAAVDDLEVTALAAGAVADSRVHFVCRGVRARERIDPHTVFYGASVTKQLIGLVLARLTLDGVADPEDLVSRWLP